VRKTPHRLEVSSVAPYVDDPDRVLSEWCLGSLSEAGFMMADGSILHGSVVPLMHRRSRRTLNDVVIRQEKIDGRFFIDPAKIGRKKDPEPGTWRYVKGAKAIPRSRLVQGTRMSYEYKEGAIPFPDPLVKPSRTILTSEGGSSPSRTRHVILQGSRHRRLTPEELEKLNGFRPGWTSGLSDTRRGFLMGNAVVVPLVRAIGRELADLPT
jgi:DNA (cytosine-5)-methyltransferase 1